LRRGAQFPHTRRAARPALTRRLEAPQIFATFLTAAGAVAILRGPADGLLLSLLLLAGGLGLLAVLTARVVRGAYVMGVRGFGSVVDGDCGSRRRRGRSADLAGCPVWTRAWVAEAVQELLRRLGAEGQPQAEVIRTAAELGGTVERDAVYDICGYDDTLMLRGFTRPYGRPDPRPRAGLFIMKVRLAHGAIAR
jgi:hypothetical protein